MPIKKLSSALLICAALCLGLTGCIGSYFGTTMPDSLRQHGIAANAKILDIWDTGWTVNDDPAIGMHIEVRPTDRPAFRNQSASRLATATERWRPPVQPTAMVR